MISLTLFLLSNCCYACCLINWASPQLFRDVPFQSMRSISQSWISKPVRPPFKPMVDEGLAEPWSFLEASKSSKLASFGALLDSMRFMLENVTCFQVSCVFSIGFTPPQVCTILTAYIQVFASLLLSIWMQTASTAMTNSSKAITTNIYTGKSSAFAILQASTGLVPASRSLCCLF
ncbi:hypothetical protein FGO68_gene9007 [Halteria grandinella]|uniref:Secreted protein n=1 Tax=Halteria grandinella TaxID=5974 RepID=A0A8J8NKM9_HALGN|nr:hypothetical protein FGO68_gene9007 [Halteria grandinella]